MARKRDAIQIQTEVTTDEEWEQELARPGLTVVDVYTDWCGPCASMVGTLKKVKFELGDDMLNYLTARSDDITALESFRNRSEPLWLFFGSGFPVYQLRGAHSPLLARKIVEELEKEKKSLAGQSERTVITLQCDTPAAIQLPPSAAAGAASDDDAEAAEALEARRRRSEMRVRRALAAYGILVVGAAAVERRDEIVDLLDSCGFSVAVETRATLTEEQAAALVAPPPPPPPPSQPETEGEGDAGVAAAPSSAEPAEGAPPEGTPPEEAPPEDAPAEDAPSEGAPADAAPDEASPADAAPDEASPAEEAPAAAKADPEQEAAEAARRQAVTERLLEGECILLAVKDSEFTEDRPHRWLYVYLGRPPAPPPGGDLQPELPASPAGGQQGAESPAEPPEAAAEPEPEPETEPGPEPEPSLSARLTELLGEEMAPAVFTPDTIQGQWTSLRAHFPELCRPPEPPREPEPEPARSVAFALFGGDSEQAAQGLAEAGFTVLHSGVGELTEEVAGQLVSRLEGGESQIPALVATPILAAAVAGDGGAALAAIANLDPLYLSDSADKADSDAKLVFGSWGVEIPSLTTTEGGGGSNVEGTASGAIEGTASDAIEGAASGAIEGAASGAIEGAASGGTEAVAGGTEVATEETAAEEPAAREGEAVAEPAASGEGGGEE